MAEEIEGFVEEGAWERPVRRYVANLLLDFIQLGFDGPVFLAENLGGVHIYLSISILPDGARELGDCGHRRVK
jgi:hypothetical protein